MSRKREQEEHDFFSLLWNEASCQEPGREDAGQRPCTCHSNYSHLWSDLQTLMKLPSSSVRQRGYNYPVLQTGDGDTNRLSALPQAHWFLHHSRSAWALPAPLTPTLGSLPLHPGHGHCPADTGTGLGQPKARLHWGREVEKQGTVRWLDDSA